jgi:large subunit ribosomal protein L9
MSASKLILTQEVTGLGSAGDTVEVKGGYARNYLLPRGLAILATRGAQKQIESLRRARATREVRSQEEATAVAGQLSGLTVRVPARAGAGGRLFGRVTTADVAAAVTAAGGPSPDRAAQQHQDHGRAHRHRAGAPRGHDPADDRGRRRLNKDLPAPTARTRGGALQGVARPSHRSHAHGESLDGALPGRGVGLRSGAPSGVLGPVAPPAAVDGA